MGSPIPLVYNLFGNGFPLGSPIPLVYNLLGNGFPLGSPIPLVYNIKPLALLVFFFYNMNNQSMSSIIKLSEYEISHGQPWSYLVQRRIVTTIVSMFKSIPLGSLIPLVYNFLGSDFPLGSPLSLLYNIKPLGLLVLLVYNINNRSMSSMIKCHILTNIVSI